MSIDCIVKNNFCTGCGACISEDDSKQAKMVWSDEGFLVPQLGMASTQEKMIKVCPFYTNQKDEDELGEIFIKNKDSNYQDKIGYYFDLYVGYSQQFRKTSSSGGIATYIFSQLLNNKIVDNLFIVKEKNGQYSYQIFSDVKDITRISKTRYTPVTLEKLFEIIDNIDGTIAISGVACFVKAIRLKQYYYPELKQKIPFIVGIICGGLKSKYYTDFLAQAAGCFDEYGFAEYRVKNENSYASDYQFSCERKKNKRIHMTEMKQLGDMWGTGLFKSNACDFCDDVLTELADISLGDAWISPYQQDGLGTSVIITRSKIGNDIIKEGLKNQNLNLEQLTIEKLLSSQQGSFNHRHKGLAYRLNSFSRAECIPKKRERFIEKQNFIFNKIQEMRKNTRGYSLKYWVQSKNIQKFNLLMRPLLIKLSFYTKLNNRFLRLLNFLKKVAGLK